MDLNDTKYSKFALVEEMLETVEIVRNLNVSKILKTEIKNSRIALTGEGSSRIFPAKNCIFSALENGFRDSFTTSSASEAGEFDLSGFSVFVVSNSGKTAECVRLIKTLREKGHDSIIGVVAGDNTPIMNQSDEHYLLTCGKEDAVAATKSVVEQALFYDLLFRNRNGAPMPAMEKLARLIEQILKQRIPEEITDRLAQSEIIYFAGRNNGVAEELTLKTNEITRKKSDFLEGTYAVHGIEEVMNKNETVVVIDPFKEEEEKFKDVLVDGVGLNVVSISSRDTLFPTVKIPSYPGFEGYLQLVAGWNLLVETGIANSINLDKPQRARKIGNEFVE